VTLTPPLNNVVNDHDPLIIVAVSNRFVLHLLKLLSHQILYLLFKGSGC
jgi:hypothetical protein